MSNQYIEYNKDTGEIIAAVSMSERNFYGMRQDLWGDEITSRYMEVPESSPSYEASMDMNYYVDIASSPSDIIEKSDLSISLDKDEILSDGVDECTFSNIPSGTQVKVYGPSLVDYITVNDGTFEFSTIHKGVYSFEFSKGFQYKIESFRVSSI